MPKEVKQITHGCGAHSWHTPSINQTSQCTGVVLAESKLREMCHKAPGGGSLRLRAERQVAQEPGTEEPLKTLFSRLCSSLRFCSILLPSCKQTFFASSELEAGKSSHLNHCPFLSPSVPKP